jgi:hypothetical protein
MRKALFVIALMLALTTMASSQEYWNIRTSLQGLAAKPSDDNSIGFGGAAMITFGLPGGKYDIGFEIAKWWRSYALEDPLMKQLHDQGNPNIYKSDADINQEGLRFSLLGRYRVLSLLSDNRINLYTGLGGGFYFFQESREEAKQNPLTGLYAIQMIDRYLETKGQTFLLLGFDGNIINHVDLFWENRFSYIFNWNRWDDPYEIGSSLGLRYDF